MSAPTFRPQFDSLTLKPPEPYDPSKYPALEEDEEEMMFGDLFHRIYRRAANHFDLVKSAGNSSYHIAMEYFTTFIIQYVMQTAAWIDGQAPDPPAVKHLRTQLTALKSQAYQHYYNFWESLKGEPIHHELKALELWFMPRIVRLTDLAFDLHKKVNAGKTTVQVTAVFELDVDVSASGAKEFVRQEACKELFLGDNSRFVKLKVLSLKEENVPSNDSEAPRKEGS